MLFDSPFSTGRFLPACLMSRSELDATWGIRTSTAERAERTSTTALQLQTCQNVGTRQETSTHNSSKFTNQCNSCRSRKHNPVQRCTNFYSPNACIHMANIFLASSIGQSNPQAEHSTTSNSPGTAIRRQSNRCENSECLYPHAYNPIRGALCSSARPTDNAPRPSCPSTTTQCCAHTTS